MAFVVAPRFLKMAASVSETSFKFRHGSSAMALPVIAMACLPSFSPVSANMCPLTRSRDSVKKFLPQGRNLYMWPNGGFSHSVSRSHGRPSFKREFATCSSNLKIELIPCLKDNYAYLLYDTEAGVTAVIDPSESEPVEAALSKRGLHLTHVINTHHHWDHTNGNKNLKSKYKAEVVGPKADKDRIPFIDVALGEGDTWQFGGHEVQIFDTPGHTRGHVSFYIPSIEAVFTGDTLFALGCGRLFEGTPEQMWKSLSKLSSLPPLTRVYCGHEYTQSNAKFALHLEAENEALKDRAKKIGQLRSQNLPTVPSTLEEEFATNPFLRPQSEEIRKKLQVSDKASDAETFAAIRRAKDNF